MKKYSSVSIGRQKPAKINVQYRGILGAHGPKRIPHKICLHTGKQVAAVGKDSLVITGLRGFFCIESPNYK